MRFHVPFTLAGINTLKKQSRVFIINTAEKDIHLQELLERAEVGITAEEYKAICMRSLIISFFTTFILVLAFLLYFGVRGAFLLGLGVAVLFSIFIFVRQRVYPQLYEGRRTREIERNLIPALEDMLVQLNSGIPVFNIMVNIAVADYGELSKEFRNIVRKINAGYPQVEVLDEFGEKNLSLFFKRTLWQLSNGMRAGSDLSIVIKESIKSLSEEQLLQIQNYGNKLNPLVMFYLLISVILPALSITFMTILFSMLNLTTSISIVLFVGIFVFVVIIQVMFFGIIKSSRPSLF